MNIARAIYAHLLNKSKQAIKAMQPQGGKKSDLIICTANKKAKASHICKYILCYKHYKRKLGWYFASRHFRKILVSVSSSIKEVCRLELSIKISFGLMISKLYKNQIFNLKRKLEMTELIKIVKHIVIFTV